jgi:hypothetical protein
MNSSRFLKSSLERQISNVQHLRIFAYIFNNSNPIRVNLKKHGIMKEKNRSIQMIASLAMGIFTGKSSGDHSD